jgi:hypothetical protein
VVQAVAVLKEPLLELAQPVKVLLVVQVLILVARLAVVVAVQALLVETLVAQHKTLEAMVALGFAQQLLAPEFFMLVVVVQAFLPYQRPHLVVEAVAVMAV